MTVKTWNEEASLYLEARAEVYRFGVRWHWKCRRGRCLGGSKRTQEEAIGAAVRHVAEEHVREIPTSRLPQDEETTR